MLNQRLFAALLAVTTAMTAVAATITVDVPSSYAGNPITYTDEAADGSVWLMRKFKQGGKWVVERVRQVKPPKPKPKTFQQIDQERKKICREDPNAVICEKRQ